MTTQLTSDAPAKPSENAPFEMNQLLPIACDVNAVPVAERARWLEVGRAIYGAVDRVNELEDGYAFRLPADQLELVAEYVGRDRLCCSFLHWEIIVEQEVGPLWLNIRGSADAKRFLKAAMEHTTMLPADVARAAGFMQESPKTVAVENVAELASQLNRQHLEGQ